MSVTIPNIFTPSTIAKANEVNANFSAIKAAIDTLSVGAGIAAMSQVQRDAIASPATGTVIFNTTTNKLNVRIPTGWDVLGATSSAGALSRIGITPASATPLTGATQQFTATGYDANGVVVPVSPVWSVSAAPIAPGTPVTITVFSSPADGYIASKNTDYLIARAGAALVATAGGDAGLGNDYYDLQYQIQQAFLSFDTSVIPDTATINSVGLSGQGIGSSFGSGWAMHARAHDWGIALDTGDFVAGANLGAKTLLATRAFAGDWSTTAYNAFTSEAAFLGAVNKTGYTRLLVHIDTTASTVAPSGTAYAAANLRGPSSPAPAKLVITYTA